MLIDNKKIIGLLILSNISIVSSVFAETSLATVEDRSIPIDSVQESSFKSSDNNVFSEQKTNNSLSNLSYNSNNPKNSIADAQAKLSPDSISNAESPETDYTDTNSLRPADTKQVYKELESNNTSFNFSEDNLNTKPNEENRVQVLRELQNMSPNERLTRLENIIEIQKSQRYENKIKSLQDEVQELRGLLEAERHKIEKSLAQQRLLYEDLDRRFTQVKNSSNTTTSANNNYNFQDKKVEQQDLYTEAYQRIKQRDYPKAIELFNKYLDTYPTGIFCANANYWLGEIYMLQSDYQKALAAFDVVLSKYPKSTKSADAMYKKALVYIYLKDYPKAKLTLIQVKQQYKNTTVARLADKKLQGIENFNNET